MSDARAPGADFRPWLHYFINLNREMEALHCFIFLLPPVVLEIRSTLILGRLLTKLLRLEKGTAWFDGPAKVLKVCPVSLVTRLENRKGKRRKLKIQR